MPVSSSQVLLSPPEQLPKNTPGEGREEGREGGREGGRVSDKGGRNRLGAGLDIAVDSSFVFPSFRFAGSGHRGVNLKKLFI